MRIKVAPIAERTGHDGTVFDSKSEMRRWYDLTMLERAGLIRDLKRQPEFMVDIGGKHFCTYTADHTFVMCSTGDRIVEEVKSKGSRTQAYMLRRKAAELYHNITVTEYMV